MRILLFDNIVPYCWYVKTQLILYFIWWITLSLEKQYKLKIQNFLIIIFILLLIYSFYQYYNNITSTTYITVFNFLFGSLYSQIINNKKLKCTKLKLFLIESILLMLVIILTIIFPRENTIFSNIIINITTGLFAIFIFNTLYFIKYNNTLTYHLGILSYYVYIVQSIAQCFFQKTYFCNNSFLNLNNNVIALLGTIILDILLAYLIYILYTNYSKIIDKIKK